VTFRTRLDHFNATGNDTPPTFALRYIINEEFNPNRSGPILFYAGNEGAIEGFYDNSGFMTRTLAERLNATVVFGEHRYYGGSFPFDSKDEALKPENLKYLSVEQVMMDYVTLLEYVKASGGYDKTDHINPRTPVYAFGGSYGGMLASWLRMKYPTTFHGAIASSAPILWFMGAKDFDPHAYDSITDQAAR
jgi:lysosomal Pro-X carboxypeptidase